MLNVVVFGNHKTNVQESPCIMNIVASKLSLRMHSMPASEASPYILYLYTILIYYTILWSGLENKDNSLKTFLNVDISPYNSEPFLSH